MKHAWRSSLVAGALVLALAGSATAPPTTNVWNPNTDVQAPGTFHLGIDNYFSVSRNRTQPFAFPTAIGLTYGVGHGLEIGVDALEPTKTPFVFNAKWALPETKSLPALAIGGQSFGTNAATQGNILYGLLAKTLGKFGRLTAGGYVGKKAVVGEDNSGAIVAWDRAFGPKWWASVGYATGNNNYGALALGGSYRFAPNVGLILGYVFFNNHSVNTNDTVTAQLDIDF